MPTPEQLARQNIDALLQQCGWIVQSRAEMNLGAGRGCHAQYRPAHHRRTRNRRISTETPMTYNPQKHHCQSIRLRQYDYAWPGAYFVTICVREKECVLGEIVDGEMQLSRLGQIVHDIWDSLPIRYPEIELDAFVIMPNHMHGIVVIVGGVGAIHELPLQDSPHNGAICCCLKSWAISK